MTPKQENFCMTYIETGNASEAYRQAYDADEMQATTVNRKAKELLDNGKITARIGELQNDACLRHKTTVDTLLLELEEAREQAMATGQASAAIAATWAKARLLGLDKSAVQLQHEITMPRLIELVAPMQKHTPAE